MANDDSLRQHIGRLLFVGVPGPTLDEATRVALEQLHVGGVILFRRNAGTPSDIAALTAALHALPSRPLVAIDHEGGRVMRLDEPFTQFPPSARIGATQDAQLAYETGHAMALELGSVGIEMSFAPVLDVHSNAANPVIGDRAFSADPAIVGKLGVAMLRGLRVGGVIPCGKHFPGHGDTETDSHHELPIVRRSREALEQTELVPFRAAIAAGIPALMTAHVVYPALDPNHPATLSRTILGGLLRDTLGFEGAIASDDLEMRAISDHASPGDAAIASLQAGIDLLLVCQDLNKACMVFEAIDAAIRSEVLDAAIITAASHRVERLQSRRAREARACRLPNSAHRRLVERIPG